MFRQKRSGRGDTVFHIYKFRSMTNKPSAPSAAAANPYTWKNGVPDDFVFKSSALDNPNITKTGRFIRKYSLDELPQFLNVLKGDMSLIGPRPEIIEITRCYNANQRKRLAVKPGISGLAQVNGRSLNHGEKIRHDLDYVERFSLRLDLKIILKTISSVFRAGDAV
ncbi:sugar transferase [Barrientosiimonas marina]